MAIDFDGTGDFLSVVALPGISSSATALTMACWANLDDITHAHVMMCVSDSGLTNFYQLAGRGDQAGDFVRFSAPASAFAATSLAYTAGTYQHFCGVNSSSTVRAAFLNGANKGTNGSTYTAASLDRFNVGSNPGGTSPVFGVVAEAAIWNIALSDAEVADLAQGLSPLMVKPASLVYYLPMWGVGDLIDRMGGLTVAVNGNPTTGDHCRIYYPGFNTLNAINVNSAPVITSNGGGSTAAVSVAENTAAVTTVTATDADSDTLTYSISGGTDQTKFSIGSSSGVLTFVTAPDYEIPTDSNTDNDYVVIVQVSDGVDTDTQTITVTVTNVATEDDDGTAVAAVVARRRRMRRFQLGYYN